MPIQYNVWATANAEWIDEHPEDRNRLLIAGERLYMMKTAKA